MRKEGNRPVNFLSEVASNFGKTAKRLVLIDRALADAGLRRKGVGRTTPAPTNEERIALLLAVNSAAAPLAWRGKDKEPTVKDAPQEASKLMALPFSGSNGPIGGFERSTLGETLVALAEGFDFSLLDPSDPHKNLRIELNLTTETATIDMPGESAWMQFGRGGMGKSLFAETLVVIQGTALRVFGQGPVGNP